MTVKVDVETVDSLRRRLAVEVPAEMVSAELERAYVDLGRAARVPGFRPGRAPRRVLERMFGDRVRPEVFGKLIENSYAEVLAQEHLEPVGRPEIVTEQAEPGAALRYSAMVEVRPAIVVQQYAGLAVERPLAPVTAADIDASMDGLRQSFAQLHPVMDRSHAQTGDVVTLDYEADIAGRRVARAENREVELGASQFPPRFEAHVLGAEVGAALDFEVPYAEDHAVPELAGQTVHFRVRLRALSRPELPTLDDEFAKDHGECSTLAELRERVRRRLEDAAARAADDAVRRRILTLLAETHEIPVPRALVQRRTAALIDDVRHDWRQRGIAPKDDAAAVARLREQLEPRAREQVKVGLLLDAIADQEHLEVRDVDVETHIATLVAQAGTAGERVRALYQDAEARAQVRARLRQAHAIDLVVQRAHVTTVPAAASVAETGENG